MRIQDVARHRKEFHGATREFWEASKELKVTFREA